MPCQISKTQIQNDFFVCNFFVYYDMIALYFTSNRKWGPHT